MSAQGKQDPSWPEWAGLVPQCHPHSTGPCLAWAALGIAVLLCLVQCPELNESPLCWLLQIVREVHCTTKMFSWPWPPSHPTSPTCGFEALFLT